MKEAKRNESVIKSVVWRLLGVLILGTITYLYTNSWFITTTVTVIHHATFLVVFYLHERAWIRIKWLRDIVGKKRNIIKALFYEIVLGMGLGGLIVFSVTGSFPMVTKITGTYTVVKIITYYFYDKIFPELKKGK